MTETPHTTALHMLSMSLDPRALFTLARRNHLPLREVDFSYLVHSALAELFGAHAPGPFHIEDGDHQRTVRVLAYSQLDADALHHLARGFADPTTYRIIRWEELASKPMPDTFPEGMRLGFRLRACPVVRQREGRNTRRELDAYLAEVARSERTGEEPEDRMRVYERWLVDWFARRDGVHLESVRADQFTLRTLFTRGRAQPDARRPWRTQTRPSVDLSGALEVHDGAALRSLLAAGIGRHKMSGFGMLLLRRLPTP